METKTADHLLQKAFVNEKTLSRWADLGCGSGFFTQALARQLKPGSAVYAIDKQNSFEKVFEKHDQIHIDFEIADFEKEDLDLKDLDGILMANALHFVKNKKALIEKLSAYLLPDGKFLIVEYDTERSNHWVPYPISFLSLRDLFADQGFGTIEKMAETPSAYGHGMIYACLIQK